MKNKYEIKDNVAVIFLKRREGMVLKTLISTSSFEKVNSFEGTRYAFYSKHGDCYYARGRFVKDDGSVKWILMHRFLINAAEDKEVDHMNGNTLDNTDANLRQATHSQNMQNKKHAHKNSKTGIRGVCWHKQRGKWYVQLGVNKRKVYIGTFDDLKEAEMAAVKARKELMPYSQENIKNYTEVCKNEQN
ncbi:MAG: AP2 domain-containing protein [Bacillota bacterium]